MSTTSSVSSASASGTSQMSLYVSMTNGIDTEECGVSHLQAPPCKTLRYALEKSSTSVFKSGMVAIKKDVEILLEPGTYFIEDPLKIALVGNLCLTAVMNSKTNTSAVVIMTSLNLNIISNPTATATITTSFNPKREEEEQRMSHVTLEGLDFFGGHLQFDGNVNVKISNCTIKNGNLQINHQTFNASIQIEDCQFLDYFNITLQSTPDGIGRIDRSLFQGDVSARGDSTTVYLFGFDHFTFDSCHFERSDSPNN
jgi:hypothetical protein